MINNEQTAILTKMTDDLFGGNPEAMKTWMATKNPGLGNKAPIQVLSEEPAPFGIMSVQAAARKMQFV